MEIRKKKAFTLLWVSLIALSLAGLVSYLVVKGFFPQRLTSQLETNASSNKDPIAGLGEPGEILLNTKSNNEKLFPDAVDRSEFAATPNIQKPNVEPVVKIDKAEAFKPIIKLRNLLILTISINILSVLIISLYLVRAITRPIVNLTHAAGKISAEDRYLNHDGLAPDKADFLTRAFNQITTRLVESNKKLDRKSEQLKKEFVARNHSEIAFHEANMRLNTLIQAIPDLIFFKNVQGRYLVVNRAFEEFVGFQKEKIIGNTDEELFPQALAEYCRQGDEHVIWTRKPIRLEEESIREDGTKRFFDTIKVPLIDGSSSLLGSVAVSRDITDQRKFEVKLRQAQKMESIGTLAGGIAHDFNNILMTIIGNTEIALLHELPERSSARHSLTEVLNACRRATDLVRQILTLSRQKEQELKPVKVTPIVKEIIKLLRASLPTTIKIHQKLTAEHDTILGDLSQIHQVLMNLCTNSAQAMHKEGGVLAVKMDNVDLDSATVASYPELSPGSYLVLSVSDTGHGIAPSDIERIFDPYFTTQPVGVGTGLGLAVVHGIVTNSGGTIIAESEPGKGSTFKVFLPRIESTAGAEIETRKAILTGQEHVLFVDDEESLVNMGKRMLEKLRYKVSGLTSSIEALKTFRSQPESFDLVITDLTMPDLTGDKLAKKLKCIRADIPIILCTGYSDLITEDMSKTIGIREFIIKPFAMHEMAQAIRRVLDE